jgi:Spy/CpxP family protein refolding chaperone
MKKLRLLLIVLTVLGVVNVAHSGPWNMGAESRLDPSRYPQLELTGDQKAKLQALNQALVAEINPLRDLLFNKKMELQALWSQTNADQARIAEKQEEIQATRTRMQELITKYQMDCRECLTPEQRRKLVAMPSCWCGKGRRGERR